MPSRTSYLGLSRSQILSFRRRVGSLDERLPPGPQSLRRAAWAFDIASRLHALLDGKRMPFGKAGQAMGVQPNSLRYPAQTSTIILRWDGARQPVIWTAPAPDMDPRHASVEFARRHLHIFGPATVAAFAKWAGIRPTEARAGFEALADALTPVRTPVGNAWILAEDLAAFRASGGSAAPARLLPSGDMYYLFWGSDQGLLVPEAERRAALWTTQIWPGAPLVRGEIAGVWRRSSAEVKIEAWRRLSSAEREAIEVEMVSLPLPGLNRPITVRWS